MTSEPHAKHWFFSSPLRRLMLPPATTTAADLEKWLSAHVPENGEPVPSLSVVSVGATYVAASYAVHILSAAE